MPPRQDNEKFSNRLDIALDAVHAAGDIHILGAAVSRAYRVDENEVGEIESGVLIVDKMVGRRGRFAVGAHFDPLRSEGAEVQPYR